MDPFEKELTKEKEQRKVQERANRLEHGIKELMQNDLFLRFVKELSVLQSIDDARCFDNALAMSYNNGRRSIMVEIKGLFTNEQWSKIMEFDLNVRPN